MTKEVVDRTLKAEPFKPFAFRLTDGSRVAVPHPDFVFLTQGGRTAFVNTEGEDVVILDLGLVTAIEFDLPKPPELPKNPSR